MADEIVIRGTIALGKSQFTRAALPLGTETVETTIGTHDVMIVVADAAVPRLK